MTRSLRSSRDARAGQNDNAKAANTIASGATSNQDSSATNDVSNKNGSNRPSRIVTLKYGSGDVSSSTDAISATPSGAAPSIGVPTSARETRNSRARAAASGTPAVPAADTDSSRVDGTLSVNAGPETPRTKRVKRGSVAEETPRSTRQSTRLRASAHEPSGDNDAADIPAVSQGAQTSPLPPTASNTRSRNRNRNVADSGANVSTRNRPLTSAAESPALEDPASQAADAPDPMDVDSHSTGASSTTEISPKGKVSSDHQNPEGDYSALDVKDEHKFMSTRSSPILSRKRKSLESDSRGAILSTSSSPSKKPKVEGAALDRASEPTLQNGDDRRMEDEFPQADDGLAPKADEGSRQITEEADDSTTPDNAAEAGISKATRGGRTRGRGRGARNRTSARFGAGRRGRGGARAVRSGRTGRQNDNSSDIEFERSPSPSAATQKLRDRQRELDKAFRKVAAAQRLALAVLATQSEKRIARDKNAHKAVPEYDDISLMLEARLREKQDTLKRELELQVAQENRLFQANKEAIEERCQVGSK